MRTKIQEEVFHINGFNILNDILLMSKRGKKGTLLKYNTFWLYAPTFQPSTVIEKIV